MEAVSNQYDAIIHQCGKYPIGDGFLELILARESPIVTRAAYNLLLRADQTIVNEKVKYLMVSYILISNSNNKRLQCTTMP